MSERASASPPSSCSGDMYWNVPEDRARARSAAALACASVAMTDAPETGRAPAAASGFARPKSSSFTPVFVSMTLPGFRSRCTIPCRCALSSASAISIAVAQDLLDRQRALARAGPRASRPRGAP